MESDLYDGYEYKVVISSLLRIYSYNDDGNSNSGNYTYADGD